MKIAPSSDERSSAKPRLSVVMPVWNGSRFLGEAIESILAQDFRDFELIIVDDASTDSTPEILARWAARDERIRLLRNESNLGSPASRNRGVELAQGEYIACHDADDVSLPRRFSAEVAALDADPGASMVSMNYRFIDEEGRTLRTERRDHPPGIVDILLSFTNPVGGHSQVMFRRQAALRAGGYHPRHRFGEDPELWTRLGAVGRIVILPQLGVGYRLHSGQKTAGGEREETRARNLARARQLVSAVVGREVSEGEVGDLIAVWHGGRGQFDAARADALLRELDCALASKSGADRRLRMRFRRLVATRLAVTAAILVRAWRWRSAAALFRNAMAWSPGVALTAPLRQLADTMAFRLRSRRRGAR